MFALTLLSLFLTRQPSTGIFWRRERHQTRIRRTTADVLHLLSLKPVFDGILSRAHKRSSTIS